MYVRPTRYMCLHPLPQRPRTARSLGRGRRSSGLPWRGWVGGLLDGQGCGLSPGHSWLLRRRRGGSSGCFSGVGASPGRFLRSGARGCRRRDCASTVLAFVSLPCCRTRKWGFHSLGPCCSACGSLLRLRWRIVVSGRGGRSATRARTCTCCTQGTRGLQWGSGAR